MKVGLVICTYNRPQYLKLCFESLKRADLRKIHSVLIVDDCSTNEETMNEINSFGFKANPEVIIYKKDKNKSIKDSLLFGFNFFFERGFDIVINLDSDAIVRNDFVDRLLELKSKYPELIVTGFNCNTLNKDGSIRHKHLYSDDGAIFRASVGGINMCIGRPQYLKFVKPALVYTLSQGGNWDAVSCINSMEDSLPIAVTVPSVVNHIGINSAMGHATGGEPPDTAEDFKPLSLPNVTLVGVADDAKGLFKAATICCENIHFGEVKILTNWYTEGSPDRIRKLGSKEQYSKFIFKELVDHIKTDYFILFQADGFILNWKAWTDEFYNYDYIGAPWNWYQDEGKIGNGGFSFRSKKLHQLLQNDKYQLLNDGFIKSLQEDHNICRIHRRELEAEGIKFAPVELANKFSIEAWATDDNQYKYSFGFHGFSVNFHGTQLPYIPYILPNNKREIF